MHEPRIAESFRSLSGLAAEDGSWSIDTGHLLLLSALLLILAGAFGGLRVLLASPLRLSLVQFLPERQRARVVPRLEPAQRLSAAAGMTRLLCVVAAAALWSPALRGLSTAWQLSAWAAAILLAGLLMEGWAFLVLHRRLLKATLALLPALHLLAWLFRPFTALMWSATRALGADPTTDPNGPLAADLLLVASDSDRAEELADHERRMIGHVIELPETDAAEVMTPRTEISAIGAGESLAAALAVSRQDGRSRLLVLDGDIDHVVGVFYLRDALHVLEKGGRLDQELVRDHMRKPYFVPETMRVPALLEELRRRRTHLAVVVDEYGGTSGVVTIEDLLEEIVGDIQEEHDRADEALYFQQLSKDELIVDGRLSVAELNERFATYLPEDEDYDTLAGMMFDLLGHIPQRGESVQVDGARLEVVDADDRRIRRVRVQRAAGVADAMHAG